MHDTKHSTDRHPRRIRSYVRREGRITAAQQKALESLWPDYGLPEDRLLDQAAVFGREAPLTLEIGFGNGDSLAEMAAQEPGIDFIGIDVHRPGVGRLLSVIEHRELHNVRIYCHDAVEVITHCIQDNSLDRVLLFFPDPWPKKKHHKRRIVQQEFIRLLALKIKQGGILHLATDWQPYAEHMMEVMSASPLFTNTAGKGNYSPRPHYRPITKFERRGRNLGHAVSDLIFARNDRVVP